MPASLRVFLAGMLFSLGGALIKSCTFPSLQRAGMRAAIAAVALFALLPAARRRPSRRALLLLLPCFGATCLFVVATSMTTAANAIFLQSTYPFWVTLLSPLLLHERPKRSELVVLGCIGVGMTLFFVAPAVRTATAPQPRLGDLLAIVSGLSYGTLLLGFRWLGRGGGDDQCAAVAWGNVFTAPLALALMPVFGQRFAAGDATSWAAITALGVFQVGLAYAVLVRAIAQVPAVQASLLLMIEPALNPVLAFAVHGEVPHWLAIAGGAVILTAVAAGGVLAARAR